MSIKASLYTCVSGLSLGLGMDEVRRQFASQKIITSVLSDHLRCDCGALGLSITALVT